ncbi:hypothetical protein R3P38DRAFT_3007558 [Favolaschia claudopus]|uniref:Transmembrane protein n=1 Tax=Favolaschia claudopus TaxID=2862362 RepID=A0AAW0AKA2_9AGAR
MRQGLQRLSQVFKCFSSRSRVFLIRYFAPSRICQAQNTESSVRHEIDGIFSELSKVISEIISELSDLSPTELPVSSSGLSILPLSSSSMQMGLITTPFPQQSTATSLDILPGSSFFSASTVTLATATQTPPTTESYMRMSWPSPTNAPPASHSSPQINTIAAVVSIVVLSVIAAGIILWWYRRRLPLRRIIRTRRAEEQTRLISPFNLPQLTRSADRPNFRPDTRNDYPVSQQIFQIELAAARLKVSELEAQENRSLRHIPREMRWLLRRVQSREEVQTLSEIQTQLQTAREDIDILLRRMNLMAANAEPVWWERAGGA